MKWIAMSGAQLALKGMETSSNKVRKFLPELFLREGKAPRWSCLPGEKLSEIRLGPLAALALCRAMC
jgi:hypothetical protein